MAAYDSPHTAEDSGCSSCQRSALGPQTPSVGVSGRAPRTPDDTTTNVSAASCSRSDDEVNVREVLCHWLFEVATEWGLISDSLSVFGQALQYLDGFMRLTRPPLNFLQLVGISCLRLAMQQALAVGERGSPRASSLLAASRFSDMCGGAYEDRDVERMTQLLETALMQGRLGVPPPLPPPQQQAAALEGEASAS